MVSLCALYRYICTYMCAHMYKHTWKPEDNSRLFPQLLKQVVSLSRSWPSRPGWPPSELQEPACVLLLSVAVGKWAAHTAPRGL